VEIGSKRTKTVCFRVPEEKLNLHLQNHSEVYCESCPIDIAVRGIKKLFTKKNKK